MGARVRAKSTGEREDGRQGHWCPEGRVSGGRAPPPLLAQPASRPRLPSRLLQPVRGLPLLVPAGSAPRLVGRWGVKSEHATTRAGDLRGQMRLRQGGRFYFVRSQQMKRGVNAKTWLTQNRSRHMFSLNITEVCL